jgi:hypothetical protein
MAAATLASSIHAAESVRVGIINATTDAPFFIADAKGYLMPLQMGDSRGPAAPEMLSILTKYLLIKARAVPPRRRSRNRPRHTRSSWPQVAGTLAAVFAGVKASPARHSGSLTRMVRQ